MSFQEEIQDYIKASYPCIYVVAREEWRAIKEIEEACKSINRISHTWSITNGLDYNLSRPIDKKLTDPVDFIKTRLKPDDGVYCLVNFHYPSIIDTPEMIQLIKDCVQIGRSKGQILIFVSNIWKIPEELVGDITRIDFSLPDKKLLDDKISFILKSISEVNSKLIRPNKEERELIVEAGLGMTTWEFENSLSLSIIKNKRIDSKFIGEEKAKTVAKSGILEFYRPDVNMSDVGGLENLKEWLTHRRESFGLEAQKYGLPFPKGILLIGIPGTGKCIDKNSILWYSNGMKRIKSLLNTTKQESNINIDVVSFNTGTNKFEIKNATNIFKNDVKQGYCINLNQGYQIKTSPWHPIWCEIDGVLDYHKVEDINPNQEVWIPLKVGHNYEGVYQTLSLKYDTSKNILNGRVLGGNGIIKTILTEHNDTIIINENIAYLLGVLYGDGSLSQLDKPEHQHNTTLGFTTADDEILEYVKNILSSEFNDTKEVKKLKTSKYGYIISSAKLAALLRLLQACCRSENKGVPDIIFESPKSVIRAFIQGLFDTDGYSDKKRGNIQYCSASEELARDVHNLLLSFGIISRLYFKNNKCLGAWNIDIFGEKAKIFYNNIGFRLARKQNNENKLPLNRGNNLPLYPPGLSKVIKNLFLSRKTRGVDITHYVTTNNTNRKAATKWGRYYMDSGNHRTISPNMLKTFINEMNAYDNKELQNYYGHGDIFWFKVNKIDQCNVDLYDISVTDNNSFVANGFINHNSLCAKSIASDWGLPLIRFDLGKLFQGLVGASEERTRKAIELCDAVAPCVVWIDEIEKGMSGVGGSGNTDSGVTSRVFGSLLTWLQEKKRPVFVVATANQIQNLPPELMRAGRWDEIFFIDLPNENEREEIIKIHITRKNRKPKDYNIQKIVSVTEQFSGAELESIIIKAMTYAFAENREFTTEDILKAISKTVPLAVMRKEEIGALRDWASTRAVFASKEKEIVEQGEIKRLIKV